MSLKNISEKALNEINDITTSGLSDKQKQQVSAVLEQALLQAVEQIHASHRQATVNCCGPESDLAHKIQNEASKALDALTTNLMAMR